MDDSGILWNYRHRMQEALRKGDLSGLTAIMQECGMDPSRLDAALGVRRSDMPSLLALVPWKNTSMVSSMLASGMSPNASIESGYTSLISACGLHAPMTVEVLLEAGADPNLPSAGGHLPLHESLSTHEPREWSLLLEAGADPDGALTNGRRPLHQACARGDRKACRILLDAGARPGLADTAGMLPIHLAAANGHQEIVEMLAAAGSPVPLDEPLSDGGTLREMAHPCLSVWVAEQDARLLDNAIPSVTIGPVRPRL